VWIVSEDTIPVGSVPSHEVEIVHSLKIAFNCVVVGHFPERLLCKRVIHRLEAMVYRRTVTPPLTANLGPEMISTEKWDPRYGRLLVSETRRDRMQPRAGDLSQTGHDPCRRNWTFMAVTTGTFPFCLL